MEKNALRKRRLEGRVSRPRLGNRRRLVAQRRQQDFERDSSGIYDYVDPLSFQVNIGTLRTSRKSYIGFLRKTQFKISEWYAITLLSNL